MRSAVASLFASLITFVATVSLAQTPLDRAAVERDATLMGEAYLDLLDAGRHDEAIARYSVGAEPLLRPAIALRLPRGMLSGRKVAAVSGRSGDVQITYHYTAEFPEKTMRGLPLATHVETLVLIRRASDGKLFIINHRVGS